MSVDLCNEVGDPKNFYFIYPAESATGGYLDINDAVERDAGRTPVCVLYLTHMVGQDRAVEMMSNPKLREKHLFVFKMPNYQGKGFDAVVLRYSEVPLVSGEPLNAIATIGLTLLAAVGGFLGLSGMNGLLFQCKDDDNVKNCKVGAKLILVMSAFFMYFPITRFLKEMKASRHKGERARELETNMMGFKARTWEESKQSQKAEAPKAVAAGRLDTRTSYQLMKKSKTSKRRFGRNEQEFRRLRSGTLEATVAGAAAPRTYR